MTIKLLLKYLLRRKEFFFYRGIQLQYINDLRMIDSERRVEIPIAMDFAKKYDPSEVLEVGCVLPHVGYGNHDVVDLGINKGDLKFNIYDKDIASFQHPTGKKYSLVISISTIEHIGHDEPDYKPGKVLTAINNIRQNLVRKDGRFVATFGMGINDWLDVHHTEFGANCYYMHRICRENNVWTMGAGSKLYGWPFPRANTLAIMEWGS